MKAHLVPKQTLKREIYYRARRGGMGRVNAREYAQGMAWDERTWRWVCGGISGLGGHHGQVDNKQIAWGPWPEDLLEFLREHNLEWMAEAYV